MTDQDKPGTRKMRVPEPETRTALLPNAKNRWWTRHVYVRTVPHDITVRTAAGLEIQQVHAFIYRCELTGLERVWGIED